MALTPSTMLPLGTQAPDFNLFNTVTGQKTSLQSLQSDVGTVIMFLCNHCPYVKHIMPGLLQLAQDYIKKGISFVGISSNDAQAYPADSPAKMKELALQDNYPFPYLYDETQEVAKAYQAACTPDFYVFDARLKLVYRGQLDDSRPGNGLPVTGQDLREALNCLLEGKPLNPGQKPSIGCNIKWKTD